MTSKPSEFLSALYEGLPGDWHVNIAAIWPKQSDDQKPTDGYTFSLKGEFVRLDNLIDVDRFVERWNSSRNIYYGVNPSPKTSLSGRYKKETFAAGVRYVHVDIDPADDAAPDWKQEVLPLIHATAIVDSGNGLQAVFRLVEQIDSETAEAINSGLIEKFGGDLAAKDVSRLLRMPFTTNIPDGKKRAKGRTECTATLVQAPNGQFPISDFIVKANEPSRLAQAQPLRIDDEYLKYVIEHGEKPKREEDEPWGDLSKARYYVIQRLLDMGSSDSQIAGVICRAPLVSDKKGDAKWAASEIARVRKRRSSDLPTHQQRFLDEGWMLCMIANKFRVARYEYSAAFKREVLRVVSRADFTAFYSDRYHYEQHGNRQVKIDQAAEFLHNKAAPRYVDLVLNPRVPDRSYKNERGEHVLNLWRNYTVACCKGDRAPQRIRDHILNVWCSGDKQLAKYCWQWLCLVIQKPDELPKVALVVLGDRGTGKSVVFRCFGRLLGQHFMHVMTTDALTTNFNAEQKDVTFLLADESFWAGDAKAENQLKGVITEDTRVFERKGIDKEVGANMVSVAMVTNNSRAVPAGTKERRYCVVEVNNSRMNDEAYFAPLFDMADGKNETALGQLLAACLEEDLGDFNPRVFPRTEALREQQEQHMTVVEQFYFERLQERCWHDYSNSNLDRWEHVPRTWMRKRFLEWCKGNGVRYIPSATQFGVQIKKMLPDALGETRLSCPRYLGEGRYTDDNAPERVAVFPAWQNCAQAFCEYMGPGWTVASVFHEFEGEHDVAARF